MAIKDIKFIKDAPALTNVAQRQERALAQQKINQDALANAFKRFNDQSSVTVNGYVGAKNPLEYLFDFGNAYLAQQGVQDSKRELEGLDALQAMALEQQQAQEDAMWKSLAGNQSPAPVVDTPTPTTQSVATPAPETQAPSTIPLSVDTPKQVFVNMSPNGNIDKSVLRKFGGDRKKSAEWLTKQMVGYASKAQGIPRNEVHIGAPNADPFSPNANVAPPAYSGQTPFPTMIADAGNINPLGINTPTQTPVAPATPDNNSMMSKAQSLAQLSQKPISITNPLNMPPEQYATLGKIMGKQEFLKNNFNTYTQMMQDQMKPTEQMKNDASSGITPTMRRNITLNQGSLKAGQGDVIYNADGTVTNVGYNEDNPNTLTNQMKLKQKEFEQQKELEGIKSTNQEDKLLFEKNFQTVSDARDEIANYNNKTLPIVADIYKTRAENPNGVGLGNDIIVKAQQVLGAFGLENLLGGKKITNSRLLTIASMAPLAPISAQGKEFGSQTSEKETMLLLRTVADPNMPEEVVDQRVNTWSINQAMKKASSQGLSDYADQNGYKGVDKQRGKTKVDRGNVINQMFMEIQSTTGDSASSKFINDLSPNDKALLRKHLTK